jgi:hypothetical protein
MSGAATPKRVDPKPRPVQGPAGEFSLINEDPERHYVCANLATNHIGSPGYYEGIGYDVEIQKEGKDALKFAFGRGAKVGEPMQFQGTMLMSCSKERKAEIDLHGPFSGSGLLETKRVEDLMINRRAGRRVLGPLANARGNSGEQLFDVVNETQAPQGVMRL